MKKIVLLSMIATLSCFAGKTIVLEAYLSPNEEKIAQAIEVAKEHVSFKSTDGVFKTTKTDKYTRLVIESDLETKEFQTLFSKLKTHPEFLDIYVLKDSTKTQNSVPPEIKETPKKEISKIEPPKIEAIKETPISIDKSKEFKPIEPIVVKELTLADSPYFKAKTTTEEIIPFDDYIQFVLTNYPEIKERKYNYLKNYKEFEMADNGYNPTIDLTATLGYEDSSLPNATGTNKEATIRFIQNLYAGGSTKYKIQEEEAKTLAAKYAVQEKIDRVLLAATAAYMNMLKEKELYELSKVNLAHHQELYDKMKAMFDGGYGNNSNYLQAGSRLTLANSNLIAQQNNLEDSIAAVKKFYPNIDKNTVSYPNKNIEIPMDLDYIQKQAKMNNPSIKMQEQNIIVAEKYKKQQNALFRPTLDFEAYATVSEPSTSIEEENVGALLRFKYNLYNKGNDSLKKEKSRVQVQQENEILNSLKMNLEESVRLAWQSYTLFQKKLEYLETHKEYSLNTLNTYKEEFNIGRKELISILDAESEYFNAQKEYVTIKNNYIYNQYKLLDSMGRLTPFFINRKGIEEL